MLYSKICGLICLLFFIDCSNNTSLRSKSDTEVNLNLTSSSTFVSKSQLTSKRNKSKFKCRNNKRTPFKQKKSTLTKNQDLKISPKRVSLESSSATKKYYQNETSENDAKKRNDNNTFKKEYPPDNNYYNNSPKLKANQHYINQPKALNKEEPIDPKLEKKNKNITYSNDSSATSSKSLNDINRDDEEKSDKFKHKNQDKKRRMLYESDYEVYSKANRSNEYNKKDNESISSMSSNFSKDFFSKTSSNSVLQSSPPINYFSNIDQSKYKKYDFSSYKNSSSYNETNNKVNLKTTDNEKNNKVNLKTTDNEKNIQNHETQKKQLQEKLVSKKNLLRDYEQKIENNKLEIERWKIKSQEYNKEILLCESYDKKLSEKKEALKKSYRNLKIKKTQKIQELEQKSGKAALLNINDFANYREYLNQCDNIISNEIDEQIAYSNEKFKAEQKLKAKMERLKNTKRSLDQKKDSAKANIISICDSNKNLELNIKKFEDLVEKLKKQIEIIEKKIEILNNRIKLIYKTLDLEDKQN